MKNILFVSHSAELNGAELMLLQTLKNIGREKFRPFLAAPGKGPLPEEAGRAGVRTFDVPMKWWLTEKSRVWKQPFSWALNRGGVRRISEIIGENRIDAVMTNSSACFGGALAARRAGVPHVWFIHEILDGPRPLLHYFFGRRRLVKFIHGHSARVIVNSLASRRAFDGLDRVSVVYNGVEIPGAPETAAGGPVPAPGAVREPGAPVLGIIGKVRPEKGQKEAVRILELVRRSFPGARLVVVGDVKDRRYFLRLQDLVGGLGLRDAVVFAGYRRDVARVLDPVDVLLVTSTIESFGRAAVEAMAMGKIVVAADSGGLREIVRHGQNGLLAPSADPEAMARAVVTALEDPELARSISEGASRTARERFSLKKQIEGIERILEECVGR